MSITLRPGMRLRSTVCDVQVIVVRGGSEPLDLQCGGRPMVGMGAGDDDTRSGEAPEAGYDKGTLLGKRYTDDSGALELLCTKPGPSSLSVADVPLEVKETKPLPSSD